MKQAVLVMTGGRGFGDAPATIKFCNSLPLRLGNPNTGFGVVASALLSWIRHHPSNWLFVGDTVVSALHTPHPQQP